MLSPALRQQLVFSVEITGGQDVAGYQLAWEFDSTALEYISGSQGDYLAGGVGNRDGTLATGTFVVRAVKASTVSVSGHLIRSNGFRYIPTFESAVVIVPLLGDVNRDGVVNIADLVLVGSSFTQRVPGEGNPADVNESGVVNIVDLVLVAGALSDAAAAPSVHSQKLAMLTAAEVQGWLTQAQGLALTDATSQRGILFLEQLLAALTPKETTLLSNYPNPFNPETWIPYHLAYAVDVTLTITIAAAPPMVLSGIQVTDTTPVLALRVSIVDEGTDVSKAVFRVKVKNLSTGRALSTVTGDEGNEYQLTVVDIETTRAARIGDILEISAQSPDLLVGVQPLQYTVTAEDVKRGLIQLPALVAYYIPTETELLSNYPNPFNPETWIPYRLAEDAFVALTIYDRSGQVVRTIDVGHQTAAVYESRLKAIYWDGRNEFGETVASGVYFYHLSAGDYAATQTMVILK